MIAYFENLFDSFVRSLHIINRKRVKLHCSEGRGRNFNTEFEKWLEEKGITHKITNPYSPDSNGRAGRLNRSQLDMARTMMTHSWDYCPKSLWAEALNTACYFQNRISVRNTAQARTLYEMLRCKHPDLFRLRLFGCKAYVHILKKYEDGKFGPQAEEGTLVGYGNGNLWRMPLDKCKKVILSQDVMFNELHTLFNQCNMVMLYSISNWIPLRQSIWAEIPVHWPSPKIMIVLSKSPWMKYINIIHHAEVIQEIQFLMTSFTKMKMVMMIQILMISLTGPRKVYTSYSMKSSSTIWILYGLCLSDNPGPCLYFSQRYTKVLQRSCNWRKEPFLASINEAWDNFFFREQGLEIRAATKRPESCQSKWRLRSKV